MQLRITTWNLQGREDPDLEDVAAVIAGLAPDVVALQEVQREQAAELADRLGWHHRWWFKHWTVVYPAEGLAVLSRRPIRDGRRIGLAHRWRFWSWRRRVAAAVTVDGLRIANVHLGAGVDDRERTRQAAVVLRAVGGAPAVITGDVNARPGSAVLGAFADAGFVDAWAAIRAQDEGPTNWGRRPRTEPPAQRIDYVLARGMDIVDVGVGHGPDARDPDARDPDWPRLGRLSDHAPVTATLSSIPER